LNELTELHFQPIKGKAEEILKAILQTAEVASCNNKDAGAVRLVCEEIVMNVASYAYAPEAEGWLDVKIQKTDRIIIRFEDGGMPFNPLEQKKPDIRLPWEKRRIGGLGIFLVLKKMNAVRYTYENNKNILTIEKVI